MNEYKAFRYYIALRLHFTSDYDAFKYKGKVRYSLESYNKRNDRFVFQKIAKMQDWNGYILSNVVKNPNIYSRDLLSSQAEKVYNEWKKTNSSLLYRFESLASDISIKDSLRVHDGAYPKLLELYFHGQVSAEIMIILNDLTGFIEVWNEKIDDPILWPETAKLFSNYKPFVKYSRDKYYVVLKNHW